jgi:hypothetical protein
MNALPVCLHLPVSTSSASSAESWHDWLSYLAACRMLARQCGLSLRQLDRALWVGAADPP